MLAMVVWVAAGLARAEEDVRPGDSRERVLDLLGPPSARLVVQDREILSFPRGQVVLTEGRVSSLELVSEEALRERLQREEALRLSREADAARERERRLVEGAAALERALADPALAAAPGANRLAYWRNFNRRYPEQDVSLPLATALSDWQREQAEARVKEAEARRTADLERRAAEAEARAARAEAEARDRRRTVYLGHPYYAGGYLPGTYGGWTGSPVIVPREDGRPPIVFRRDGPVGDVKISPSAQPYSPVWVHPSSNNRRGVSAEVEARAINTR
jgi:hypothetical protein